MGKVIRFHARGSAGLGFKQLDEIGTQLGCGDAGFLSHQREQFVINLASAGLPSPDGGCTDAKKPRKRRSAHGRLLSVAENSEGMRGHAAMITKSVISASSEKLPDRKMTLMAGSVSITDMATRIRKSARQHLYIKERMDQATPPLTDERLGQRMGKSATTVWRWRTQQHRLNPDKIAALAEALGCKPQALWELPSEAGADSPEARLEQLSKSVAELQGMFKKTGT